MLRPGHGLLLLIPLLLAGCAGVAPPPEPGPGEPVAWSKVPGWSDGQQDRAWQALLHSCRAIGDRPRWRPLCNAAETRPPPTPEEARAFLRARLRPHPVQAREGDSGLITGYYEPLLQGSRTPSERYPHPLYAPPPDLIPIELGERFPNLADETVRGRLTPDRRVVPYFTRAAIEGPRQPLAGNEILWVANAIDRFFLHIQGSGRVRLDDGEVVAVRYADQNGHPYRSIGRVLVERGELTMAEVTLPRIRQWLRRHPHQRRALFNANPSYIFFHLAPASQMGPTGSLGVPLTARRSLAVDPRHLPLGAPIWLATRIPSDGREGGRPYRRLVLAQDTGGAIRGPARADLFTGTGRAGEWLAGRLKHQGRLFVLLPSWQYNTKTN